MKDLERLAMQDLIRWKGNPRRKPLMVWGARQAGKTFLIKDQFAENYYPNHYVYIDKQFANVHMQTNMLHK